MLRSSLLGTLFTRLRPNIQVQWYSQWRTVCSLSLQAPQLRPQIRTPSPAESSLSEEQLRAVQTEESCVRVVAGPGSGKTRVLTHRVVHLIAHHGVSPTDILFITFTNKAAGEIRDRLLGLFGSQVSEQLTVGTFHSICARIMRQHPCFGINKNFVIFDNDDSEKLLKKIVNMCCDSLDRDYGERFGTSTSISNLSSAKSNNSSFNIGNSVEVAAEAYESEFQKDDASDRMQSHLDDLLQMGFLTPGSAENSLLKRCLIVQEASKSNGQRKITISPAAMRHLLDSIRRARLYKIKYFLAERTQRTAPPFPRNMQNAHLKMAKLYENALRRNNAVDFDDLIHLVVQRLHLSEEIREVFQERWKYILIDEFQDTDAVQYELIHMLASKYQNLFVVGDIDQAIYGWRGAEYRYMQNALKNDFPSIVTYQLQKNYRSSANILKAASVVLEHSVYDRQVGSLEALRLVPTKRYKAAPIVIAEFVTRDLEVRFILSEMQALVQQGQAVWGSFALLYRTRAQSFALETSLIKAQIPYRILGSLPFYSHKEVKILIGYLQLITNPENDIALDNCLNTPPRGIGEKTVSKVQEWAALNKISFYAVLEKMQSGYVTNKDLGITQNARNSILKFINLIHALRQMSVNASVTELLRTLTEKLQFKSYVEALKDNTASSMKRMERIELLLEAANDYGVGQEAVLSFLEDLTLVANREDKLDLTSVENQATKEDSHKDEVNLLTLHASKGLEFECVFMTGATDGLIPLHGSDLDEERRLFYVGITRAQDRLYLTHNLSPLTPWQRTSKQQEQISRFVQEIVKALPKQYYCLHNGFTVPK